MPSGSEEIDSHTLLYVLEEIIEYSMMKNKVKFGIGHSTMTLTDFPEMVEFCVLAEDSPAEQSTAIKHLCSAKKIKLIFVPSAEQLRKWIGALCYCLVIEKSNKDTVAEKMLFQYIDVASHFFERLQTPGSQSIATEFEAIIQDAATSAATTISSSIVTAMSSSIATTIESAVATSTGPITNAVTVATTAITTANTTLTAVNNAVTDSTTAVTALKDAFPSAIRIDSTQLDTATTATRNATTAMNNAKQTFDKLVEQSRVDKSLDWVYRLMMLVCSMISTIPSFADPKTTKAAAIVTGAAIGTIIVASILGSCLTNLFGKG